MEPPSTRSITILNESGLRVDESLIRRGVDTALSQHGAPDREVAVLITTDVAVHELNRIHRGVDERTDVLTFAGGEFPHEPLGDICIAGSYARRQAEARGVSLDEEVAFLAIHGALHLCGLDDEDESARAEMVAQMNRAAEAAGLKPDHEWYSMLHSVGTTASWSSGSNNVDATTGSEIENRKSKIENSGGAQ